MNYIGTLRNEVQEMARGAVALLPNLAIAFAVLLVTWIAAKFALRIANLLIGRTRLRPSLRNLVDTMVKLAIWLFGLMIALTILMPGLTPASLVAGLGIGAVAIGFAFQDIFENFLAGVLIMVREKMRIGDVIECEGITGKVEHITLRETHVRKLSGELTIVPNSILFKNPVEIFTDDAKRRHEVIAGVSYDTDLDQAAAVIRKAVESVEQVDKDLAIDVFAMEFNSSSVDFNVRWWAGSTPRNMHESRDAVVRAIKRALDDAGIEIPFPYVTHTFKEALPIKGPIKSRAED
ncbi:mechanosensitive ion channel family protein [Altererythrobacter sp. SALINAS58]|uniref:mechanosensitive ion channel family protein n=1 Tax=Alteripontixanthobacter muriae TaxID=2705546 RepID=UPI0015761945|nr:mechanosensitive ion channel family protein [Alteripontixanthobacter muriae]NTZ41635.1 mechanosensitive ion channel family protein [Alteripontixanthobacter muriae]